MIDSKLKEKMIKKYNLTKEQWEDVELIVHAAEGAKRMIIYPIIVDGRIVGRNFVIER